MIYQTKPNNPKNKDIFFDGEKFWMYLNWKFVIKYININKEIPIECENKMDWFNITGHSKFNKKVLRKEKLQKLNEKFNL